MAGKLPPSTALQTETYAEIDEHNRWQGDIYPKNSFNINKLPTDKVPYWMLINRTCHLYEGNGRKLKLDYLNFIAIYHLQNFVDLKKSNLKEQVKDIICKNERVIFLPALPRQGIEHPLIGNFNLVYTFHADDTPLASQKVLQLASPFSEHVFQKFSRFFYTVGYDDEAIRSDSHILSIIKQLERFRD